MPGVRRHRSRVALVTAAVGLAVATASTASAAPRDLSSHRASRVSVQLLAFNDYHGHLEPDTGPGRLLTDGNRRVETNGVAYLARHLKKLRRGQKHSLTVAAGDLIGKSTFTSGLFHDEPAVETLDELGLDVSSVGNHEFDEGATELLRMQNGGCHPVDGCFQQDAAGNDIRYPGADFQYLAANVVRKRTGKTVLPATWVKKVGGVKLGFIGITFGESDRLIAPGGIVGYRFLDEVRAGNRAAKMLQKKKGVKAIVVLLHEGGLQSGSYNGCAGIAGPIVDIAQRLAPKIDAVISGHTHAAYACKIRDPKGNFRSVTSADSFGRIVTEINLKIDTRTGDVVRTSVNAVNQLVTRDVRQDPATRAIVRKWVAKAAGPGNRVVGTIGEDIRRSPDHGVESSLANLIADAQRASTGAQVAFMNPEAIEASLLVNRSLAGEQPGQITYREAYNVQPYGNFLQTFDMTGAQIELLLEQQWIRRGGDVLRLGISDGLTYSWSQSAPVGSRVDPASVTLNGVAVEPASSYRVAANNYLATGGNGFTAFANGAPRTGGKVDLDALIDYFTANPNVGAPPAARSTSTP